VFYLRPGTTEQGTKTVFDDGVTDILSGGADSDYFFAMLKDNPDTVVDLASGEKLTQL
jgi:hypothetical protein